MNIKLRVIELDGQLFQYNINNVLGSGSFGKVYSCRRRGEQLFTLAIKQVQIRKYGDQYKHLLQQELQVLKMINKGISYFLRLVACSQSIQKCIQDNQNVFIVTERCKQTLKDVFESKEISFKEKASLLLSLAKGFQLFLKEGFVHRDIKPQNILVSNGFIKLADFGLGKRASKAEFSRSCVGTPNYMAPQITNPGMKFHKYSQKSDVFAYGLVMFQGLLWKFKRCDQILSDLRNLDKQLKKYQDLWDICQRCISKRPDQRPTFKQIVQEIESMHLRYGWSLPYPQCNYELGDQRIYRELVSSRPFLFQLFELDREQLLRPFGEKKYVDEKVVLDVSFCTSLKAKQELESQQAMRVWQQAHLRQSEEQGRHIRIEEQHQQILHEDFY